MTTEKVMAVLTTLNHPGILLFMLPPKSLTQAAFGAYVTNKLTIGNKIIPVTFYLYVYINKKP